MISQHFKAFPHILGNLRPKPTLNRDFICKAYKFILRIKVHMSIYRAWLLYEIFECFFGSSMSKQSRYPQKFHFWFLAWTYSQKLWHFWQKCMKKIRLPNFVNFASDALRSLRMYSVCQDSGTALDLEVRFHTENNYLDF